MGDKKQLVNILLLEKDYIGEELIKLKKIIVKHNWGYDENVASEIKDIKVELVEQLTKDNEELEERSRILLKENLALKKVLKERGIIDDNMNIIDEGGGS